MDEELLPILEKIKIVIAPLLRTNGIVDLSTLENKSNLEYFIALLLNSKFVKSKDKNARSFGADDVIAIRLKVEQYTFFKYWGKIYWLSKPKNHECYRFYQDPFYGCFKLEKNQLKLVEAMFGDYEKNDLEMESWIDSEMSWMYDM